MEENILEILQKLIQKDYIIEIKGVDELTDLLSKFIKQLSSEKKEDLNGVLCDI